MTHATYDTELVSDLNDLIQLDRDATEAYTVAINSVRDPAIRDALVANRADHLRHVEELAALVRGRGAMAIELPHVTGPIKLAIQAMGAITMRDTNALLALRVVEGQVKERYAHYRDRRWPADVQPVIQRADDDEARHYRWVTDALAERGVSEQSLAGSVSSAVETLHRLVATPIETLSKQVMRFVDENRPGIPASWAPRSVSPVVERFRHALTAVEDRGELDGMVSLFADNAVLTSADRAEPAHGPEGARTFWNVYRGAFITVHTEFGAITEAPGVITMPWTSRARTLGGNDVTWQGITVIEHLDGHIRRMQMLFDGGQKG